MPVLASGEFVSNGLPAQPPFGSDNAGSLITYLGSFRKNNSGLDTVCFTCRRKLASLPK